MWSDAVREAKSQLGFNQYEYIEDWDSVVYIAHEIMEEDYEEFCEEAIGEYHYYLKSEEWKKKRLEILRRDNFICSGCGDTASQVHHMTYENLHTKQEYNDCMCVCKNCHQVIHNKAESKIRFKNLQELAKNVRVDHVVSLNTGQTIKISKEMKTMVDANNYFGGSYLKASDVKQETALTIKQAKIEKLDDRKKIVVYFDEVEKGLVLNKINTSRITKQLGTSETDEWPASKITIFATEVEYDGKDVPCIRVKKKTEKEEE
jgi:hypothetical protein